MFIPWGHRVKLGLEFTCRSCRQVYMQVTLLIPLCNIFPDRVLLPKTFHCLSVQGAITRLFQLKTLPEFSPELPDLHERLRYM